MNPLSGKFGAVQGVSTNRSWTLNRVNEAKSFRASNTYGGTGRQPGVLDWSGNIGAYGGQPIVFPGETFEFRGYTAPTTGVRGTNGAIYEGQAIVDSIALTWSWSDASIISHVINFSGNGEIEETTGLIEDDTEPDVPRFDFGRILVDGLGSGDVVADGSESGDFQNFCDLLTATLTITSENKPYVNSCSGGYRKRSDGPLDWTLAITAQNTSQALLPFSLGDNVPLKLYTSETEFWELRFAHILDFTGLTVNVETGDFVQVTINAAKNGFVPGLDGSITAPDGTQLWPVVTP